MFCGFLPRCAFLFFFQRNKTIPAPSNAAAAITATTTGMIQCSESPTKIKEQRIN